ncbi:hypothetical protein [Planobispora longispora]|uniref:Uncharacterized protein n=1 Tax=Planobispora longispora TaxID=28887 RepID=A0A8J3RVN2_9ACTN|nr:hypothetical protein [Planobispora longispora]GIH80772.1 hypothetical protein Plo01_72010 [Planobispora longispora]
MNDRDELAGLLSPAPRPHLSPGRFLLLKERVMSDITTTPRRPRLVPVAVAAVAAAAATAAAVFLGTGPAYAVTDNPDGTITVKIYQAEDPEGLQAELRARGFNAIVDYVPEGKKCSPQPRSTTWVEGVRLAGPQSEAEEDGGAGFRLDPSKVGPGQVAVLEFMVKGSGLTLQAGISDRVSAGPVAECTLVDRAP